MERRIYLIGLTDVQARVIAEMSRNHGFTPMSVAGPGEVPTSSDSNEKIAFVPFFGPDTFAATIENLVRRGVNACVGILPGKSFESCAAAFRAGAEDVVADPFTPDDIERTLRFVEKGGVRRLEPMSVRPLQEMEREAIVAALTACRGQVSLTARRLGIGRSTLYRKLEQFNITATNGV